MPIPVSQEGHERSAINLAGYRLAEVAEIKHLPPALIEKINTLKAELNAYKVGRSLTKVLVGQTLSSKEILKIIKQASHSENWNEDECQAPVDTQWIHDNFAVEFNDANAHEYCFYRETKDTHQVHLLRIIALPGHFFVSLETDRVSYDLKNLLNLIEFKQALKEHL